MKKVFEFLGEALVIFLLLMALALCLRAPDWRTVDVRQLPAESALAWNVARIHKPSGMPMLDYVERLRQANPAGWTQGEVIVVPVCEVAHR